MYVYRTITWNKKIEAFRKKKNRIQQFSYKGLEECF